MIIHVSGSLLDWNKKPIKGYWENTLSVFSSSLFNKVSKQKYSFCELLSPYRQNTSIAKVND